MILTRRNFLRAIIPAAAAAPILLEELLHPGRVFFLPPAAGWRVNSLGGYLYSQELSKVLRQSLQPLVRFREFSVPDLDFRGASAHMSQAVQVGQRWQVHENSWDQIQRGRYVPLDQLVRKG